MLDVLTDLLTVLDSTMRLSTPLLLACLAGLFSERAGIFDIGLEGKMLAAAFFNPCLLCFRKGGVQGCSRWFLHECHGNQTRCDHHHRDDHRQRPLKTWLLRHVANGLQNIARRGHQTCTSTTSCGCCAVNCLWVSCHSKSNPYPACSSVRPKIKPACSLYLCKR